jgi:hypothetical protein
MAAAARYNSTTINVDMAGIVSHDTRWNVSCKKPKVMLLILLFNIL